MISHGKTTKSDRIQSRHRRRILAVPTVSAAPPTSMKSSSSSSSSLLGSALPELVPLPERTPLGPTVSVFSSNDFAGLSDSMVSRSSSPCTSIRSRELSPGFFRRIEATDESAVWCVALVAELGGCEDFLSDGTSDAGGQAARRWFVMATIWVEGHSKSTSGMVGLGIGSLPLVEHAHRRSHFLLPKPRLGQS